ncbi:MAG: hypothetical protein Ctma_0689 [Catillopecten margaritatus gill symbiont]|uniref:Restriction endonuclease n=1 Tax=Catillopecten margaritatus gill symbiont TaxID=3083288 RepID=A0AAU6PG32_9GAMM
MLIKTQEHKTLIQNFGCSLKGVTNKFKGDNFCGLYYDWDKNNKQVLKTSYFIGACWLEENQLALQIEPKIKGLDYLTMFLKCFEHPQVSQKLSDIYQIDFNQPKIELDSNKFEITPLLIIHFLQVMKAIARKGLKKNYYSVEQNLNAKVKGKINIGKTLKHNIFKGQNHKTVCHYQEFGINCAENRLLKKALKFVQSYLAKSKIKTEDKLPQTLAYCLAPFELVSDDIEVREMKGFKNNAFFKDYSTALKLAKMILKRFAYNLQNTNATNQTPPFWIDMSLLFEKYVYALLLENNEVKYQVKGSKKTEVDFLVDDMVVDTKYKTGYGDEYDYKIEDIRQLSGYGRDIKIRGESGLKEEIAKCLIIYPSENGKELTGNLWDSAEKIKQFKEFKKIGIQLPPLNA